MFSTLYQYLIQYKQLPVPGIGTFLLERQPAVIRFTDKMVDPPSYTFALQTMDYAASKNFFTWLSNMLEIAERDAIVRFNDFAFDLKKNIDEGNIITWQGVGVLSKGFGREIKFTPFTQNKGMDAPIHAEKIIREKPEHIIRVGETERTAEQMTQMLQKQEVKKSHWWALALVFGLIGLVFLGWYFSTNGISLAATANTIKAEPQEATSTYIIIPK